MRYKCIECGNRKLKEEAYDGELRCSRAKCETCGADLLIWYDDNEDKVVLIEPIFDEEMGK